MTGRRHTPPVALLFALAAVLLVPWIVLLYLVLPSSHRAANWNLAWAGFDVALALLLVTVALTAWRRSDWLEEAAGATAVLLFVDVWFDLLTSATRAELAVAVAEAVVVELPVAAFCLMLARAARRGSARYAARAGCSACPPNSWRIAERSWLANVASPRESNRA